MKLLKKMLTNIWFYIVLFIVSLLIPFGINEAYKWGQATGNGYVTLWEAKDVFAFFGSYLSFFGSIVLGAVAVIQTANANKQTEEANKQTERANHLAAQMQQLEQAKFISMVTLVAHDRKIEEVPSSQVKNFNTPNGFVDECIDLSSDNPPCIHYFLLDTDVFNNSSYPIVQIGIHPGTRDNSNCILYGMTPYKEIPVYIPANGKLRLRIAIPSDLFKTLGVDSMSLSIDYTNIFDYTTPARLDLKNLGVPGKHCSSKYRLSKFIDIKPSDASKP